MNAENFTKSRFWFLNPVYLLAFFWWLGSRARSKTYSGLFPGLLTIPAGLALCLTAGATSAVHVGWTNNNPWYVWFWPALGATILTWGWAWPFAYVIGDKVSQLTAKVTEGLASTVLRGFVGILKYLPFARPAWDRLDSEDRGTNPDGTPRYAKPTWLSRVLYFIGYASAVLISGRIAAGVAMTIHDAIGISTFGVGWLAGGAVAVIAFAAIVTALWHIFEHGRMAGVAVAAGLPTAYLAATQFGGNPATQWGVAAGALILFVAYAFPWAHYLLTHGLKKFVETVKPLMKQCYDIEKGDFRLLMHHVFNVAISAGLTWFAFWLTNSLVGWSQGVSIGVAALTAICSYLGVIHCLRHNGGNGIVSFFTSLGTGIYVGFSVFGALHWALSALILVVTGVVVFCVVFPAAFWVVRKMFERITWGLGSAVDKLHKKIEDGSGIL